MDLMNVYKIYNKSSNKFAGSSYFDDGQFALKNGMLIMIENITPLFITVDVNGINKNLMSGAKTYLHSSLWITVNYFLWAHKVQIFLLTATVQKLLQISITGLPVHIRHSQIRTTGTGYNQELEHTTAS